MIPADVFAFQASGILGKFEPGSTLATSDAKSIGRDCKCHYDAIVFSMLNLVNYYIVLLALLLLLVVVLMVVVEYILFILVVLAAVVIASVPAAVLWCLVDLLVV